MKNYSNYISVLSLVMAMLFIVSLTSCDPDEPTKEDTPEMITQVTLTFTPENGGDAIVVEAVDPDGEGIKDIEVEDAIMLARNTTYALEISLINGLLASAEPGYDITEEVQEEADEHLFFFGWENDVFSDPSGNGNTDNRQDPVNYTDEDEQGLPLGLTSSWTTINDAASGTFNVILKHQPEIKSETSTANDGESDVDITFDIEIQ